MRDFITYRNREYRVEIVPDDENPAPWENEDGHGPVSEWTRRAKRPGEIAIASDRDLRRYYDFQEACNIARREGWGFLPGQLIVDRFAHHGKRKFRAYVQFRKDLTAYGPDRNAAISALYAMHRATMTARQYAADAAKRDMDRMRQWCDGYWCYVGVVVTARCPCCDDSTGRQESLWGIESDAENYLDDVARELAEKIAA